MQIVLLPPSWLQDCFDTVSGVVGLQSQIKGLRSQIWKTFLRASSPKWLALGQTLKILLRMRLNLNKNRRASQLRFGADGALYCWRLYLYCLLGDSHRPVSLRRPD